MASIGSKEIKLLDFNSSRMIANKFAGEVVDVIGDTEFCGKMTALFALFLCLLLRIGEHTYYTSTLSTGNREELTEIGKVKTSIIQVP